MRRLLKDILEDAILVNLDNILDCVKLGVLLEGIGLEVGEASVVFPDFNSFCCEDDAKLAPGFFDPD